MSGCVIPGAVRFTGYSSLMVGAIAPPVRGDGGIASPRVSSTVERGTALMAMKQLVFNGTPPAALTGFRRAKQIRDDR